MEQLVRDGAALAYADAGHGAPPLVFVHDRGRDHTAFAAQVAHFRRRHRVVALDLRGHGRSDAPHQACPVEGFADDVAWLCRELGVHRPVLVGHGLGGVIALACAARSPTLPAGIVCLAAPILAPPAGQDALGDQLEAGRTAETGAAPAHVLVTAGAYLWAYDGVRAAIARRIPVLCVSTTVPLADLDRFRDLCPQVVEERIDVADRGLPWGAAAPVNATIDRFLELLPHMNTDGDGRARINR